MTVVAAMVCDDCILVGADSQVTLNGYTRLENKLFNHHSDAIAWGVAGDLGVGQEFTEWLQEYEMNGQSWGNFIADAATKIAELNGHLIHRRELANVPFEKADRSGVIIASYVDGKPHVLELEYDGSITRLAEGKFIATGSGNVHAGVAYFTLLNAQKDNFNYGLDTLRFIMGITVNHDEYCGFPIKIKKITQDSITDIE